MNSYPYAHCMPTDDVRHDVYLTMVSGVFTKGTKRADKNVEINVEILDDRDIVIPVCAVCCIVCVCSLYAPCVAGYLFKCVLSCQLSILITKFASRVARI